LGKIVTDEGSASSVFQHEEQIHDHQNALRKRTLFVNQIDEFVSSDKRAINEEVSLQGGREYTIIDAGQTPNDDSWHVDGNLAQQIVMFLNVNILAERTMGFR
jgi:hypothetical protein